MGGQSFTSANNLRYLVDKVFDYDIVDQEDRQPALLARRIVPTEAAAELTVRNRA